MIGSWPAIGNRRGRLVRSGRAIIAAANLEKAGENMGAHVNYPARLKRIQDRMGQQGIDVLIAPRLSPAGYVFGAFVPWRGIAIIPREGEPELYVLALDSERVKDDSFYKNVQPVAPLPGMLMWERITSSIQAKGLEKGTIGVELGHSPIRIETFLLAREHGG